MLSRMCSLEPDLLSLFGVMPDVEDSLESKLRELEGSKRREETSLGVKLQRGRLQVSRLQTEKEGIKLVWLYFRSIHVSALVVKPM